MVKVGEILEKLSPELKYGERIMNFELGDVEFDTFKQADIFMYEYTNSKNPNIKLRIKDDFPFRVVLTEKRDNIICGVTWNGQKRLEWKKE